jgi:hypothetical protein
LIDPEHVTDDVTHLLTEARVHVITFAPHTSQIFPVLAVALFRVLERRPRYGLPFEDEKETVKFIIKVYHDLKQAIMEPNIQEAFKAIEFEFELNTEAERCRLLFNKDEMPRRLPFLSDYQLHFPIKTKLRTSTSLSQPFAEFERLIVFRTGLNCFQMFRSFHIKKLTGVQLSESRWWTWCLQRFCPFALCGLFNYMNALL